MKTNKVKYIFSNLLAKAGVVLVVGSLAAAIYFTVQTATLGARVVELENAEKGLIEEGEKMSAAMIKSSSLMEVAAKAEEYGFLKPDKVVYPIEDTEVAKLP